MKVAIIGGGIIGLSTAYYLQKSGFEVTVIDKSDFTDNCSHGNLGYISPSHFVPLATPGIVKQGLKWMLNSSSPFYVKPRLSMDLLRWGLAFYRSANKELMERNMPHLNNLIQLSRRLVVDMRDEIGDTFELTEKGCWMLYKQEKTASHEKHLAHIAQEYGLKTAIYDRAGVESIEALEVQVLGGVLYYDDAYVEPGKLMHALKNFLHGKGVQFLPNNTILGFEKKGEQITGVLLENEKIEISKVVVATGSQLPYIMRMLEQRILVQPGKGYSFVYEHLPKNLNLPAILVDHRVATSPYASKLRIGGTMEIAGHNNRMLPNRINAIYNAFKLYYPSIAIAPPLLNETWYGYRPLSPDGMPYIGQSSGYRNVYIAGAHAMLGVTAAMGTGFIIDQMIKDETPIIDVKAFNPGRFSS